MSTPDFVLFGAPEVERVIKQDPQNIVEGTPEQSSWLYSNDVPTGSRSGFWECTAGKFRAKMDGYTEFCHIIEGEAHVTDLGTGMVYTVRAGDVFVMQAGLETEWHVPAFIRKSFTLCELRA